MAKGSKAKTGANAVGADARAAALRAYAERVSWKLAPWEPAVSDRTAPEIEREIAKVNQQLDRLADAIAAGGAMGGLVNELQERERRRTTLQAELASLASERPNIQAGNSPRPECLETIRVMLSPHVKCDVNVVVETIGVFIVEYRLWRRQTNGTPNGRAFRQWVKGSHAKLRTFEAWLRTDPLPRACKPLPNGDALEQMTWQREDLATRVSNLREWLSDTYDSRRPPGRPLDRARADLVECIGEVLHIAGIALKSTDGGLYEQVLYQVLEEVGLPVPEHTLSKTIRAAKSNHPAWRMEWP